MKPDTNTIRESLDRADRYGLTLIEMKFREYAAINYDVPLETLHPVQVSEIRNAFFAGLSSYQGVILGGLSEGDDLTDEEVALCDEYSARVMEEVETFAEGMLAKLMETQGTA